MRHESRERPLLGPLLVLLGGALAGAAHLTGALWALGWVGIALVAAGLTMRAPVLASAAALLLGGFAGHWLAHPWHFHGLDRYLPGGEETVWAWVVPFTLAWTLPQKLPVLAAWLAGRRFQAPAWVYVPAGWWAGEALWDATVGLSHDAWLYSQYQFPGALKLVAHLGWTPALLLSLAAASALGEALVNRSRLALGVAGFGCALLLLTPSLPAGRPDAFAGIGAVHLASYFKLPQQAPPGVTTLVWPEVTDSRRPRLAEGPGHGKRIAPPAPTQTAHLVGRLTRTTEGLHNAFISLAPDGTVVANRAKVRLFPLTERPLYGVFWGVEPLVAGQASPVVAAGAHRVGGLICLEELDRAVALRARRDGASMLAIIANDSDMGRSAVASEQMIAIAVLRAVETGLPVVRASLNGPSAFVSADGRVLATAAPGTDGVLTVPGP